MDCPVQSSAARAIFTIFSCAVVISGPKAAMTWSNFHLVMLELMSRAIAKVKIIVEMLLQVYFFIQPCLMFPYISNNSGVC